ncbi:MAG: hypothetical protein MPF33_02720 [Candidatus Aramenus sp.]|jgi:urease accessory protein UreE|nr:hypothetical protein [Candidatus Aramenus sp.]
MAKRLGKLEEVGNAVEEAKATGKFLEVELEREEIERRRFAVKLKDREVKVNLLGQRLEDGDVVRVEDYLLLVRQKEELAVAIKLGDPTSAFKAGFVIGNLHLRVMQGEGVVYVPTSEYDASFLLERLKEFQPRLEKVRFRPNLEAFQVVVKVEPKGLPAL